MLMDMSCIKLNDFFCTQIKFSAAETGSNSEWTDTFDAACASEADSTSPSADSATPVETDNMVSRELLDPFTAGVTGPASAVTPMETQTEGSAESGMYWGKTACPAAADTLEHEVGAAAEDNGTADTSARSFIGSDNVLQLMRSMISISGKTAAGSIMDSYLASEN